MSEARKYGEEEVKEIFDLAARRNEIERPNSNLHAFLEPTATGHRLRLGTRKGSAFPAFAMGTTGLAIGLFLLTLFFFEDLGRASLVMPVLMAAFGGGVLASRASVSPV